MVYLEAAIKEFPWKKSIYFMYTWGIPVVGVISNKAAGSMSTALVWVDSFVGVSQAFFLFINYFENTFFGGTTLSDGFIILSTLFILTYMEGKFSGEHSLRVDFW